MGDTAIEDRRAQFAGLHIAGCFVLPNAWDVGSARVLAALGAEAIATTSSGQAASLGRHDQQVTRDELLHHVESLASSVDVPLSVDSERLYVSTDLTVARTTVRLLADAGAAAVSVEDYLPGRGLMPLGASVELVAVAAEEAHAHGMTLTARAENHLYGVDDLGDTIERLQAYAAAGADVVYAPGPSEPSVLRQICESVSAPVNALLRDGGPSVPELAALGVRRVSTGGALAFAAYGAVATAMRELLGPGTSGFMAGALSAADRDAAFGI